MFAGEHLVLNVEADVSSAQVEPVRNLRVTAVGCVTTGTTAEGVPEPVDCTTQGVHFEPLSVVLTFDAATAQPLRVDLKTLVSLDHGTEERRVVFRITDMDHPEMIPMERTAWVQPPMRGVN